MKKILVTGGTGHLGTALMTQFSERNTPVYVLSSRGKPGSPEGVRFIRGDLTVAQSLRNKLNDFEVVIHCASNPADSDRVDDQGTANLLQAIRSKRKPHLIYVSIVGIDQSDYPYYQNKYEAEKRIKASGWPYTILRFTQFHDFVLHRIVQTLADVNHPVLRIPNGMAFQSIDVNEVAGIIHEMVENPQNLTINLGGPEVLTIKEILTSYLDNLEKPLKMEPCDTDNPFYNLFTSGHNLCPNDKYGNVKWSEFLNESHFPHLH